MSFSEIAVIGAVALVVLGPERLPKVARTAGHLFGRLQRYVNSVKADISREMDASEFSKLKQDVQDAARSFEQTVQQHANTVETEARQLQASAEATAAEAGSATNAGSIANPTGASLEFAPEQIPAGVEPVIPNTAPLALVGQGALDFGIEPLRRRAPLPTRCEAPPQ
jgi:sec-independent protein translocase protein TatB